MSYKYAKENKIVLWVIIVMLVLLFICSVSRAADLSSELPVIRSAAVRNGCVGNDLLLLCAVRLQENGRAGCEFGVTHLTAWETNLDIQAGWSAATIMAHHKRFGSPEVTTEFIHSLADRYCPAEVDRQGNINWKRNVPQLYKKLGGK